MEEASKDFLKVLEMDPNHAKALKFMKAIKSEKSESKKKEIENDEKG